MTAYAVHFCMLRGLSSGDCQEQLVLSFLGVLTDNLFGQEITAAEEGKSPNPYLHCIFTGESFRVSNPAVSLYFLGIETSRTASFCKGCFSQCTMHRQSLLLINRSFIHLQSEEGTAASGQAQSDSVTVSSPKL